MSDIEPGEGGWGYSPIRCPECTGRCLTNKTDLSCIECPFETRADTPTGRRLIQEYRDNL